MPRPGGGSLGHSKHRKAFGHNPRSSRQKLTMELDARKREEEKKKPEGEFVDDIKKLFKR